MARIILETSWLLLAAYICMRVYGLEALGLLIALKSTAKING